MCRSILKCVSGNSRFPCLSRLLLEMSAMRGVTETGSILDRIVEDTRALREREKREKPEAVLRESFVEVDEQWALDLAIDSPRGQAPANSPIQIVAEIKKASPSKGILAEKLDYLQVARDYTLAGA